MVILHLATVLLECHAWWNHPPRHWHPPAKKAGGSVGKVYVLDPEGYRDGVRTLAHGAVDELEAGLAVALVGARCVPAFSPQAPNSRVLTLIHICQAEEHSTE